MKADQSITSYPDINNLLTILVKNLKDILEIQLIGVYLTGSLTYGDFDLGSSDIDLLVVLNSALSGEQREKVKNLYNQIGIQYPEWAKRIECSYITKDMLQYVDPPKKPRPYVNGGKMWDPDPPYGNEWLINLNALYECGIALIGPDPKVLIGHPVDIQEVREASKNDLYQEWEPLLNNPKPLEDNHFQAYVTLTLCRILYRDKHDPIASKRTSSNWVKRTYGKPWIALIEKAENWQHGQSMNSIKEILKFIRFVLKELQGTDANKVEVVPYNSQWPLLFEIEAKRIKDALDDNCITIHHIGSTAVPNLSAKPVIDMIPVVKNILLVKNAIPAMEKLGYESRGEYGMLFRHYFVKRVPNQFFNIHVFEENNPDIERHLKFRDWMRTHPDDREAYQKLKVNLAVKFPDDIFSYVTGKDQFVESIDKKTGFDGLRAVLALKDQEWDAVRRFRQKYFFDNVPIADPYTWTFKDKKHAHIILYKGIKIIGYAHIQFWPDERSALWIIVIDKIYRRQGYGNQFLKICERWLKNQGIRVLQIKSSPEAYPFYIPYGYTEMPYNDPDANETDPQNISIGKFL